MSEQTAVARGDWLVAAAAHQPTDRLDVRIRVLAPENTPLRHWTPVHLHIGAADVPARVALRRGASILAGEEGLAQLRLQRPIHAANGDRFVLRDQSATRSIGGGVVIDPFPPARRRAQRPLVLAALDGHDARKSLVLLLGVNGEGVELEWLAGVYNLPLGKVMAMVPADAIVVQTRVHTAFSAEQVTQLQKKVAERVLDFHARDRNAAGLELTQLHSAMARALPREIFIELVKLVAPRAGLQVHGSLLRAAGHDPTDNPRDAELWRKVRSLLDGAGMAIPSVRELAEASGSPIQPLRDLLHRKSAGGELVKVTLERFALAETIEMLGRKAVETANSQPDGVFTAAQYRDTIGTGRGLAIEILECLDKRKLTVRRGDRRVLRGS